MEYEINKKYPYSEVDGIYKWWETHKQYAVNSLEEGGFIITPRDPEIYKNERIEELKAFLSDTDYVVIKLYETYIENPTAYESMRQQYEEIISKRISAREEINKLQQN